LIPAQQDEPDVLDLNTEENTGEVHMVAILRNFRGRGLGNILNIMALRKLAPQQPRYIYLTTDLWRMSAVKSYLSAGFKPVLYEDGMMGRWREALTVLKVPQADMVDNDGNSVCKIEPYV
jgi:ribosomal protein S18 acetylase RimI-like enzyme